MPSGLWPVCVPIAGGIDGVCRAQCWRTKCDAGTHAVVSTLYGGESVCACVPN